MSNSDLPSRRAVLGSAAWAVPVITVATAAPALAVSDPTSTLIFTRGASRTAVPSSFSPYLDLLFRDAQLVPGSAVEENQLTMVVTFDGGDLHDYQTDLGLWLPTGQHTGFGVPSETWVYSAAAPAGSALTFGDTGSDRFVTETEKSATTGTFNVTFMGSGFQSSTTPISSIGPRATAVHDSPVARARARR